MGFLGCACVPPMAGDNEDPRRETQAAAWGGPGDGITLVLASRSDRHGCMIAGGDTGNGVAADGVRRWPSALPDAAAFAAGLGIAWSAEAPLPEARPRQKAAS